ncbi:hypothetical protein Ddc_23590 [Ditylenchus destructor]|nr:hypothetical protein Ddc_23590 [Ditylenchus destructor]
MSLQIFLFQNTQLFSLFVIVFFVAGILPGPGQGLQGQVLSTQGGQSQQGQESQGGTQGQGIQVVQGTPIKSVGGPSKFE